jgi:structural maintenance of chromosome 1
LTSIVGTSTQAVEEQKKMEATLSVEVENARVRITEIQVELESAIEQLGEAKVLCGIQWH